MSSSDDQIIQSVDGIISAVEKLVGDIRVAPDIETEAKTFALNKVGAVAKDLDLINRALFLNEYPPFSEDIDEQDGASRTSIVAETDDTINDMLSSWSRPQSQTQLQTQSQTQSQAPDGEVDAGSSDADNGSQEGPLDKKPRIIVSPVTRTVPEKDELESAETEESAEEPDFSVASSFQESLMSSLSHVETSLDDGNGASEAHLSEGDETLQEGTVFQAGFIPNDKKPTDDLTLIRGIDDDVIKLLAQQGIHTFLDISEFREADMLRLSEELSDPCRVSRENWIEQATLLSQDIPSFYAQKSTDEVFFDRLSLNKYYTIDPEIPEVIEEPVGAMEDGKTDTLAERLTLVEQPQAQEQDLSELHSEEQQDDVIDAENEEEISEGFYQEPPETQVNVDELTAVDTAGVQEFTDALLAKKQALEAELESLTAQMVQRTEIGQSAETDTTFSDYEQDEAVRPPVVEVLTHELGQNELVGASERQESNEGSGFISEDDLGDGPIWHEEVSMGKDYVPPVVEDDVRADEDDQVHEFQAPPFTQSQEDLSSYQFHDHLHDQQGAIKRNEEGPFLQDNHFQGSHVQEGNALNETGGPDVFTSQASQFVADEDVSSSHDGGYTYNVDQLSEHAPVSHLDEMRNFHRQGDNIAGAQQDGFLSVPPSEPTQEGLSMSGVHQGGPDGLSTSLPPSPDQLSSADLSFDPAFSSSSSQQDLRAPGSHLEQGYPEHNFGQGPQTELQSGLTPEVPQPPHAGHVMADTSFETPREEFGDRSAPLNQTDYMDGISTPRDIKVPEGPQPRSDHEQGLEHPRFMERALSPSDLRTTDSEQDIGQYAEHPGRDAFGAALQVNETVSDKVPEIKEKIRNGQTLGQYLASKSQSEVAEATNGKRDDQTLPQDFLDEGGQASPPLPPVAEETNEYHRQNMSINLPPSPPVAPQIQMSDMGRAFVPPSNVPHPPAPPVASGIKVPPVASREVQGKQLPEMGLPEFNEQDMRHAEAFAEPQQDRGHLPPFVDGTEGRAMPPLPPKGLAPQEGVLPKEGLPPQSPPTQVEGPTPPPFTDMPSPMSEGQAYADTQRIIAAKRKADVERAINKSDIPNGQAYTDTQHLMDNGIPFEAPQNSRRLVGPDGIPPLPPEAAKAASAYPRGGNNPDLHYRGQKPQQLPQDGLPPLEAKNGGHLAPRNGERNGKHKKVASSGFKAKAKQLAESLQRSFVDKD